MNIDDVLAEHDARRWSAPDASPRSILPDVYFLGTGPNPLEVAIARSAGRPRADDVRKLWRARQGGQASPLLLVVVYERSGSGGWAASVCGPAGESPPLVADLDLGQVERLAAAALDEPSHHAAVRFLVAMLPEVDGELPGVRNVGMLATHELIHGVPTRADWADATRASQKLTSLRGRALVEGLGFEVEALSVASSVLTVRDAKRAVAVFLDEGETFDDAGERFGGTTPVSHALALAKRENLPWVVVTRGRQIRLFAARPDTGVGRKGPAETYVEANLALLPDDHAGYLSLLFGSKALAPGGTFEEILETSADFAADLGARLRDRVYFDVVPRLAAAVASRIDPDHEPTESDLEHAYEQALTILFRLLFIAYAEDKELLPYRLNSLYTDHSLKHLARRLTERRRAGDEQFDDESTDLWDDVRTLWRSVHKGNHDWGVPGYDGGLFSSDRKVNPAGAAINRLACTNAEFGPALSALLVDEGPDDVIGPVDFRSLSVREFGTIYEGLLESRLSVAPSDLTVDTRGNYVPATQKGTAVVSRGEVYFHNRGGARKSTGSYFTKPFAVEHLLDHALEPALDDHIERLQHLVDAGDEAAAADLFFDFRCVDLAMGSGHFLVAAVDRIEARLSAFLALNPIPAITSELETLRQAALAALGELAPGVEIETTSLLRRQAARRCLYGVDVNAIAVELARLAIWIHTFVPGLPLSFLDHSLVVGNSLTGLGTLDEAIEILDPESARNGQISVFRDQLVTFIERSKAALRRLANITEASTADIDAARAAQSEAVEAVQPARKLFDILVSARLGVIDVPLEIGEGRLARHRGAVGASTRAEELQALHLPIAFPEVFLRDRPGFDCVLGNPPWEEITVEKLGFWALRYPGLKSMTQAEQHLELRRHEIARPDLIEEYEREVDLTDDYRAALVAGPYPGMGTGDPDAYKAFCWRFWQLCRVEGAIGVVLPRSALSAAGSGPWRDAVLSGGAFDDVTFVLNSGGWVFDDAEYRYTIAFVTIRKGGRHVGELRLRGPFSSLKRFIVGTDKPPATIAVDDFKSWSSNASFPMIPSESALDVFIKLRAHPRLDAQKGGWVARPTTEFHATADKPSFVLDPRSLDGLWPVYKGASFNIWEPDTGTYYAWAKPAKIAKILQEKRLRSARRAKSPFAGFTPTWIADPGTLPCCRPRITFRDVARATDTRTVIAALVPGEIAITNQAPYLLWPRGDERDQAYLLGVLCSIPLDWYARRVVETHVNFHIFNGFPVPRPDRDDRVRRRVEELAGRLAAGDDRYDEWASVVGVPVGTMTDPDERADAVAELDAAVALLYDLDASDVRTIFETFHDGWDPTPRLTAVFDHFHRLQQ